MARMKDIPRSKLLIISVLVSCLAIPTHAWPLSIIHLNDFHARFEETSLSSGTCYSDDCIGGFSRVYTAVNQLLAERPNPIFLNAGDNFQGTLWYTMFRWNVTQQFLNMLPTDAITLGNHEFDNKIEGVVPFLQTINAPVVVSNIDDSLEPSIQGLYEKSVVIERDGRRIGIVGVILSTTNELSSTENLQFLDESESVNAEAQRLLDEEGVFTVIVLSHCGYEIDQEIASKAISGISVIVGAHSHTLLYTGTPPFGNAYGEYPTVIQNINDEPVLIVQASAYTKYLGDLQVEYDDEGRLTGWGGNPVFLDQNVAQDEIINALLEPFRQQVEEAGNVILGTSNVLLDSNCRYAECNFGNFLTDAMVAHYARYPIPVAGTWTPAAIAVLNAGGIRSPIGAGNITFNDLTTANPFGNTIDYGVLKGQFIKDLMEQAATPYSNKRVTADVNLIQVSGIRVVIDVSQPVGSRVTSLRVRCFECDVPAFEEIDLDTYYPILVPSFLVTGGDGFSMIADNLLYHMVGPTDIDIYSEYVEQQSPIITGLDERIKIISEVKLSEHYHG